GRSLAETLDASLEARLQGSGKRSGLGCLGPILVRNRPPRAAEQDGVGSAGPMTQYARDPCGECSCVPHALRLDNPLEAVAVAEASDRKGRREPRLELY